MRAGQTVLDSRRWPVPPRHAFGWRPVRCPCGREFVALAALVEARAGRFCSLRCALDAQAPAAREEAS